MVAGDYSTPPIATSTQRDRRLSFRDYRSSKYISLRAHIENLNAQQLEQANTINVTTPTTTPTTTTEDRSTESFATTSLSAAKKAANQPKRLLAWTKRITSSFSCSRVEQLDEEHEPPSCPWRSATLDNVHETSDGERERDENNHDNHDDNNTQEEEPKTLPSRRPVRSSAQSPIRPPIRSSAESSSRPPVRSSAQSSIRPPVRSSAQSSIRPPVQSSAQSPLRPPVRLTERSSAAPARLTERLSAAPAPTLETVAPRPTEVSELRMGKSRRSLRLFRRYRQDSNNGRPDEALATPSKRSWSLRRHRKADIAMDPYLQFMDKRRQ